MKALKVVGKIFFFILVGAALLIALINLGKYVVF